MRPREFAEHLFYSCTPAIRQCSRTMCSVHWFGFLIVILFVVFSSFPDNFSFFPFLATPRPTLCFARNNFFFQWNVSSVQQPKHIHKITYVVASRCIFEPITIQCFLFDSLSTSQMTRLSRVYLWVWQIKKSQPCALVSVSSLHTGAECRREL